ncbi:DNA polymerase III subunit delta' [Desulfobulbus alkaliphilus]|uniref:DNA polymerase III subunit delta' n=1 Tax=Desulfobulbus alkaliphilus TaxID=869814 RepID=UPI001966624D|nr:DNA polymerase III subunit delta' [Desulfobulbus alkaliphilus]MBM9538172.1 DNA polymerase III subunit delta' [Desulfobulbus alkaliphilus]
MPFAEILGQVKAQTLLRRALASGRLAHAYLFAGPDGVGKTTTALDLAAVLLCRQPVADEACGSCPGCIKFRSGNHPDFMRIRPDGAAIKIEQIRTLKKALTFAPLESSRRVVLLDDVQTMRREAGNSLLKILEEPPPGNLLLLIGNATGALLGTIVSRCQVIPFSPLPTELAATIIVRHRPEMDRTAALSLATLADGCPGQALTMETGGVLELYYALLDAVLAGDGSPAERVEQALAFATRLSDSKERLEPLLTLVKIFLKNCMAAAVSAIGPPEALRARERWNLQQLSAKMATISLLEQALARNCNRALICEVLLLDLFDS